MNENKSTVKAISIQTCLKREHCYKNDLYVEEDPSFKRWIFRAFDKMRKQNGSHNEQKYFLSIVFHAKSGVELVNRIPFSTNRAS